MSKRTEKIVALERDAERFAGKASALHWEAAALVVLELDSGKAPKVLADQIGKSVSWTREAAKASRRWNDTPVSDRPAWSAATKGFETVADRAASERVGIPKAPAERVELARKLLEDPKVRKAVQAPSDRTIDVSGRRDPVASIETELGRVRIRIADSIATELLDLADQIDEHGARFSAADREAIRTALDRCSTALLEVAL